MKHILTMLKTSKSLGELTNKIGNVLEVWQEVSSTTIKKCFKIGFKISHTQEADEE